MLRRPIETTRLTGEVEASTHMTVRALIRRWSDRVEFDFCKQSADFANEQTPTLRVFRRLERQEGLFKLSQ